MKRSKGKKMITRDFVVVAIHGEGDRDTVNALQKHRLMTNGDVSEPDEAPDVVVILRDPDYSYRMEWPVDTWEEVEMWKDIAGWDKDKRHWKIGATIKVNIGG